MENILRSTLEKCVFSPDPIVGGIPIVECIQQNKKDKQVGGGIGLERFKDLVIPIGLFLDNANIEEILDIEEVYDKVIPDELFDSLFNSVLHSKKKESNNKTRKIVTNSKE
uniref:Uncharacterized protein n=1 Tax=viral metagenome TaxID=1070528 RepID=A0A6C0I5E2_9ZZZZ